jgi:hypothetical protein
LIKTSKRGHGGQRHISNAAEISHELVKIVDDMCEERGTTPAKLLGLATKAHLAYSGMSATNRLVAMSELFLFATALDMTALELFELAYKRAEARAGHVARTPPNRFREAEGKIT